MGNSIGSDVSNQERAKMNEYLKAYNCALRSDDNQYTDIKKYYDKG